MSEDNDGIKAGIGCVFGVVVVFIIVALIIGGITGKTNETMDWAMNGSFTLIGTVICGVVIVGFMMLSSRK